MPSNYSAPPTLADEISNLTVSNFAAAAVQISSESFTDSNTILMTAAAADDRIDSKGYLTTSSANSSFAPINNPTFTGTVTTPSHANVDTVLTSVAGKAPKDAPTFTGAVAVPGFSNVATTLAGIATNASAITALTNGAPDLLNTLDELAAALGDDANFATTITNAINAKADASSGTFTGTPNLSQGFAIGGTTVTSTAVELNILDGVTATTAELNILDGVTATTAELNLIDGVTVSTADINRVVGTTATTAELNILDGVTATTANINSIAGLTATPTELNTLDGITATTGELNIMDGVTATTTEINKLDGFTGSASDLNFAKDLAATGVTASELDILDGNTSASSTTVAAGDRLVYNDDGTMKQVAISDLVTFLNDASVITIAAAGSPSSAISGLTATVAELNLMDGVTSTTAELNFTDGVTANIQTQLDARALKSGATFTGAVNIPAGSLQLASTAVTSTAGELNILDGVTATTTELNKIAGLTATTAELNFTDGVTSNIQTQLNTKVSTSGPTFTGTVTIPTPFKIGDTSMTSTAAELNILDGVTASTGEINILDGVTATTSELNILAGLGTTQSELSVLDGITANTNELNVLDGLVASTAELNIMDGVTATTAEINIIDGNTSATSTTLVAADRLVTNDDGTMKQVAISDLVTFLNDSSVLDAVGGGGNSVSAAGAFATDNRLIRSDGTGRGLQATGITIADTNNNMSGVGTINSGAITSSGVVTGTGLTIGSAAINEAELEIIDGATVTTAELNILDGVTSTTAELNILDGVTSTTAELNILDGVTSTTAELNLLDGVTATTAELNILDGVTATTAELNILDGVTSTAAELNILDGVTSTATELNLLDGVTATTTELNYVDGVTSAIQTQFAAKAPIASPTFTGTITIGSAAISEAELEILDGATVTTAELNIIDGNTSATSTTLVAADRFVTNDDGSMKQVAISDLVTFLNDADVLTDVGSGIATNLVSLTGVSSNSTHLGTFTGSTIADSRTIKQAIQANETAIELRSPIANPTFTGEIGIGSINVSETELGILEGATVTTAELNKLDGVTSTAAQLNIVSGKTLLASSDSFSDSDNNLLTAAATKDIITGGAVLSAIQFSNSANNIVSSAAVSGSNTAGKNLTLAAGQGTGTGAGGSIVLQVAGAAGSGGSSANNLAAAVTITSDKTVTLAGNLVVQGSTTTVNQTQINVENAFVFEGTSADAHETTLTIVDPTADHTYKLPDMGSTADIGFLAAFAADPGSSPLITSTPAELNILDGVTSTAAELNILDGVTSTAAELNILDGVTATAAEINLIDGGTSRGTTALASGDGFLHNDAGTMRMTSIDKIADLFAGTGLSASSGVLSVDTLNQNTTGSAATLTTARNIGGVSFDGSANIDLPGVNSAGNQNTTGSAATLTTARTIAGVSFDGSANIAIAPTDLTSVTSTAAEINLLDAGTSGSSVGLATGDALIIGDASASNASKKVLISDLVTLMNDTDVMTNLGGSSGVTVSDSTANTNFPVVFHNESNGLLDDTGAFRYNPSSGLVIAPSLSLGGTTITSTAAELNILDGVTSTAAELNILDGVTSTAAELNILDGVTSTAAELNILDGVTATATELNLMDGVTATTAELNILDGVTATATELNLMDGVTATTAELNILDGVTSTAAELNILDGVTSTAAEINLIDGGTARGTTAVASGDGFLHNDGGTMRMTNVSKLADRLAGTGLSNSDGVLSVGTLNQNTTGSAATLTTARTIAGVSFDGSANIAIAPTDLTSVTATATELNLMDGVTATTAELNVLDGITAVVGELNALDIGSTAVGTAVASKAVILDSNKDYTGIRNLTITGNMSVAGNMTYVNSMTYTATSPNAFVFEGANANAHETTLSIVDPTADATITLPAMAAGTYHLPVMAAASTTAITSTPEELNILDGVTATATELNLMDGVTATTAELNILDGVTATATELNLMDGVTATTAELNVLDGITAVVGELNALDIGSTAVGTAVASKAVILDSNKDYTGVRNFTLSGELDAGSLDISGNADIDGTLEADAITVNGTALNTVIAGVTVTNATNSAHVLVTDNENTNEENLITFVEGATSSTGNVGLEMDGNLTYNPSTGTMTSTIFKGNIDAVDGDFDGTLETDALSIAGTAVTSTAAELNILDGVTATATELNLMDGVTATTAELNILDGVTSTAAELNILDGVTSTAAELNILDGVTSTAAELNILDGVTSTAAEINIMDGGTSASNITLADADRVVVNDGGTMKQVAMTKVAAYISAGAGGIDNVADDTTPQLGADLDTNSFHIKFDDAHGILDDAGNEQIIFQKTASAVNYLDLTNAATGNNIILTATGSDDNVGMTLTPKGSGLINIAAAGDFAIAGTAVTSTAAELNILDGVTATATELNLIDGVTATTAELNILDGVTSTAAELNILDGVTSTAAELNILDGVTATATELNLMDGVTATTAELNILDGVTSTAAELNVLDGITAVVGELNALDIGSTAVGTAVASKAVILDSNKDYTGIRNLTLTGDLTVNGTTTTVNQTNLDVSDNIIGLNRGASTNANDSGLIIERGSTGNNAAILWDESADGFVLGTTTATPASTGDLTVTAGALSVGALTVTGITIGSAGISEAELEILDGATVTTAELNILDGVTATATELNLMDGVTATTAELNILDGVTSTAAELNILDGVTSTAAELNVLDGITAVVGELNALDIGSTAVGTAVASKAVILDSNKDYTGIRNFTVTGDLTVPAGDLIIGSTAVTSTAAELNILDGVTSTAAELNALDGITAVVGELNALDIGSTAVGTAVASKAVILDSNKDYTGIRNFTVTGDLTVPAGDLIIGSTAVTSTAAELNILDGVTATATELNLMDGVTATTAELNILDGVTSTAAELNILDGVTSTATELNILDGVTSTTAELNILDGVTALAQELNLLADTAGSSNEIASGDALIIGDTSDSNATKKALVSDLVTFLNDTNVMTNLGGGSVTVSNNNANSALPVLFHTGSNGIGEDQESSSGAADRFNYNPNTGAVNIPSLKLATTAVSATAAELNIMDGGTSASNITLATSDKMIVNDGGTMKQVVMTKVEAYMSTYLSYANGGPFMPMVNGLTPPDKGLPFLNENGELNVSTKLSYQDTHSLTEGLTVFGQVLSGGTDAEAITRTKGTNKQFAITLPHYNTDEEETCIAQSANTDGANTVRIGGGFSSFNAATAIEFYAAANDTTVTGTSQANISSTGLQIGSGARVTTIENNDSLGTSDTKLCTQGNVKAYVDALTTSTTTELNLLDGVTATTAELNILDGVTATATELNLMDGVTATTAELNILDGVTSTATELNILDGKSFVDEDDMSSNSATAIASQQSIKAYVDANAGGTDTYVIVGEEGDLYSGTGSAGNANGYQFSYGNGAQNSSKSSSGTDFGINVGVACKLVRVDITYGNSGNISSGTTTFVVVKNGSNQSGNLNTSHSSGVHDTHHTSLDYDFAAGDRFNLRTTTSSRQVGPFRMTATFQVA